jgi:hypothetical protein
VIGSVHASHRVEGPRYHLPSVIIEWRSISLTWLYFVTVFANEIDYVFAGIAVGRMGRC